MWRPERMESRIMVELWEDEWLQRRYYDGQLPDAAERHLHLAARSYSDSGTAEHHLMEAIAIAPGHIAVYVSLYKFYFYKGRLPEALKLAYICLGLSASALNLDRDWRKVQGSQADFGSYDAPGARFYMFVLKAYGYLLLRTGNFSRGRKVLAKLLELDPGDRIQAKVLLAVLEKKDGDEYE